VEKEKEGWLRKRISGRKGRAVYFQ